MQNRAPNERRGPCGPLLTATSPIVLSRVLFDALLQKLCVLDEQAQAMLALAFKQKNLSARAYDRIVKVARTIADLAGAKNIEAAHVAEAIQLRNDNNF